MKRDRWWTWTPERPAEISHGASGFVVTPVLYASSSNRVSVLEPGPEITFGERRHDPVGVRFSTDVAGTSLDWRYDSTDRALTINWESRAHGEWGLRFWVILCLSGPAGARFTFDRETGMTVAGDGFRVDADKKPLMATVHDDLDALAAELDERGYFYLGSRAEQGDFMVLRFNLEEAPSMTVRIRLDDAEDIPAEAAAMPESRQAVYDVMAWNHVWDGVNDRAYTCLSRFWNTKKFGGFGVWLNDILYNAWMWGLFDAEAAIDNLDAVFAWQTEAGNFPCLVTGNDAWLDRTQPPIASWVVWSLYRRTGRRDLLERYVDGLLRNYRWWWERRRLGDTGLLCFGTSLDAGDGLYKGTKLAAKDESTMDNSPLHDPVPFEEATGKLLAADVGMNSIAAIDGEVLALMAAELGKNDLSAELRESNKAHKARIAEWLWDESRGVYANRMLDGTFVPSIAPTSFFPLAAGVATEDQTDRMIGGYLLDPAKFGGDYGLPSVTRDDPAYHDNVYWRGRIWGPLNFWTYIGLRRADRAAEATALAEMSWRLFELNWRERLCGENFNAETGAVHDQPDTDGFYAWGALLPALSVLEEHAWDGCVPGSGP